MSVFFGLRGMASIPVPSLTDGGLYWFSNLAIPDPYFILPLMTSATMLLQMEVGQRVKHLLCYSRLFLVFQLGIDMQSTNSMSTTARTVMRCIPLGVFFFTMNMPAVRFMFTTIFKSD
jgi:YidC/Oxa1 family membrane protein insertase